jgi:predicted MFS family arabinose efflux permease
MFISMTVEFLPSGLLPAIAADLDRSVATVGQLVTVFAGAVVLSAAPLSALTRRVPRRPLLLVSLLVISAAGAAAALAPTFELLAAARAVAGVAHGAFWTVAGSYAAYLVPHHLLGRAMAVTGLGGSLAGILGVPLGNALGQWLGWRAAFGAVAVLGLGAAGAAWRLLPAVMLPAPERRIRTPWAGTRPRVLLICTALLVVVLGPGIFSTFSVPWLNDVAGLSPRAVPLYLLAGGFAGTLGLLATGAFYDRFPRASLAIAGVVSVAALCGMAIVGGAGQTVGVIGVAMVWSAAYGCLPAMLQTRVMKAVAPGARPVAAALQTTAINVGFGGGAAVGGIALGVVSLPGLPWLAAAVLAVGLLVLIGTDLMTRPSD